MAVVTHGTVVRDLEIRVIECSPEPTGRRVAGVASLRIAGGDVVRHRAAKRLRADPRRLVAPVTRSVRRGQAVVIADVAVRASRNFGACRRWHLMRAGERPASGAVIKRPRIPRRGVVACRTKRSRKSCSHVVGHHASERLCAVPFIRMAAVAIRIGAGQRVVVVDVARGAGRREVCPRERPTGRAVVKIRRAPSGSGVAGRTVRKRKRSASCRVHRSSGLLPRRQVATSGSASCRSNLQTVVVADVAIRACRNFSGWRKLVQVL